MYYVEEAIKLLQFLYKLSDEVESYTLVAKPNKVTLTAILDIDEETILRYKTYNMSITHQDQKFHIVVKWED